MAIDRIWCPWRGRYIENISKNKSCFLCEELNSKNKSHLVVKKGRNVFTILNKYPYNAGHLMVCPKKHEGNIEKITQSEWQEMYEHITNAKGALDKILKPDGYNIGINLGRPAGAGLQNHLHIHIVPRWNGDTNFMITTAETKIISQSLRELAKKIIKVYTDKKIKPKKNS